MVASLDADWMQGHTGFSNQGFRRWDAASSRRTLQMRSPAEKSSTKSLPPQSGHFCSYLWRVVTAACCAAEAIVLKRRRQPAQQQDMHTGACVCWSTRGCPAASSQECLRPGPLSYSSGRYRAGRAGAHCAAEHRWSFGLTAAALRALSLSIRCCRLHRWVCGRQHRCASSYEHKLPRLKDG